MEFAVVVACTKSGGIGRNGTIPWTIPEDTQYFRRLTTIVDNPQLVNAVIMGRKTWESIPENMRPLRTRLNVIVSSSMNQSDVTGAIVVKSLDQAHAKIKELHFINTVFVIGGAQLYKEALYNHRYTKLFITMIQNDIACDTFFPLDIVRHRYSVIEKSLDIQKDGYEYCFIEMQQS